MAWLAKTFKRPFRFIEDRREHLTAGANSREHHYEMVAYADRRGKLLALDARITIDGGAYSVWPFTIGLEPGQAIGNLPGPYAFRAIAARPRRWPPTSRASCRTGAWRAPASVSPWS